MFHEPPEFMHGISKKLLAKYPQLAVINIKDAHYFISAYAQKDLQGLERKARETYGIELLNISKEMHAGQLLEKH